jgi:hypothetical protein
MAHSVLVVNLIQTYGWSKGVIQLDQLHLVETQSIKNCPVRYCHEDIGAITRSSLRLEEFFREISRLEKPQKLTSKTDVLFMDST